MNDTSPPKQTARSAKGTKNKQAEISFDPDHQWSDIAAAEQPLIVGKGSVHPHFAEVWQGAIRRQDGRLTRALLTIPVPTRTGSTAEFCLFPDAHRVAEMGSDNIGIVVRPLHFEKCAYAARLTLDHYGLFRAGGLLKVRTYVPEGAGEGSSSSGVVATERAVRAAVSRYLRRPLLPRPYEVAKMAVVAENASDPLMFDPHGPAIVFAHREGRVVRTFSGPLPRTVVLGFDTSTVGVETDRLPRARYSPEQLSALGAALGLLERSIDTQSVAELGLASTLSAKIAQTADQNPLPKPKFVETLAIADECGAAGLAVAHSGTVGALLFDPVIPHLNYRLDAAHKSLRCLGFRIRETFSTPY